MSELTKEELAWVKKVNALLAKCPSDRIGFISTGDPQLILYNKKSSEEAASRGVDEMQAINDGDLYFNSYIKFHSHVCIQF